MEAYREARGVGSLWGTLAALPGAPRSLGKAAEGRAKPSAFGLRPSASAGLPPLRRPQSLARGGAGLCSIAWSVLLSSAWALRGFAAFGWFEFLQFLLTNEGQALI